MKSRLFTSALTLFLFFVGSTYVQAQESTNKKLKIKIVTEENGKKTETIKEIDLSSVEDIGLLLEQLEVLKDMDISSDGEKISIEIKKSGDHSGSRDIDIQINDICAKACSKECISKKGFLGVHISNIEMEDGEPTGIEVIKIVENSPAQKAGLQEGDIILSIDDEEVSNVEEFVNYVGAKKSGENVSIKYKRGGQENSTEAELTERSVLREEFSVEMEEMHKEYAERYEAKSKGAFLGVTPGEAQMEVQGAVIGSVLDNTTAKEIGLQSGDVIQSVNGTAVNNFDELVKVLSVIEGGSNITLVYAREGKTQEYTGTIKSRGESNAMPYAAHKYRIAKKDGRFYFSDWDKEVTIEVSLQDISDEEATDISEKTGDELKNDLLVEELTFSPNPNDGNFNLFFRLENSDPVTIRIVDMNGREVYNEEIRNFSGSYQQQIDISDGSSGIYFMSIMQNGKQFSRKIVRD